MAGTPQRESTRVVAVPKVCGIETEYGVVLRVPAKRIRCSCRRCSSTGTSSTTRWAGTSKTSRPVVTRWVTRRRRLTAARDRDAPRQHRAHQRCAVLRGSRAPRVLHARVLGRLLSSWWPTRRGSGCWPGRCSRPAVCSTPDKRWSSTRTTPTARATATAPTRTTSSTGQCLSPTSCAISCHGSSPDRCSPAAARSVVRTAPGAVDYQLSSLCRLLRGGGRARDHAQAPDREHARRAARRSAAVPAPARDRRRRQPLRGRDLPEGRHHGDRARDDRGRLLRQRITPWSRPCRRCGWCRTTPRVGPRSSSPTGGRMTAIEVQWEFLRLAQSMPTNTGLELCGVASKWASRCSRRWESVLANARARSRRYRRPARLGHRSSRCSTCTWSATASRGRPEARAARPAVPRRAPRVARCTSDWSAPARSSA